MNDKSYKIDRPKRWHQSFNDAGGLTDAELDMVLALPLFTKIDQTKFSEKVPLEEIIRHDTRIFDVSHLQIICRQGEYSNSAYLIIQGSVGVLQQSDLDVAHAEQGNKKTFWQKLSQVWNRSRYSEVRAVGAQHSEDDLPNMTINPSELSQQPIILQQGELLGEIAALDRNQRTATLYANSDTTILELRWQGLRDMMQRDAVFKEFVLSRYRERSLSVQLKSTPLLTGLSDEAIKALVVGSRLQQYGGFEWYSQFKQLMVQSAEARIKAETLVVGHGEYLEGLMIVRSGFCRTTHVINDKEVTVGYLSRNSVIGLEEIKAAQSSEDVLSSPYSVRAIGYVDMLVIPTALVEQYILPVLQDSVHSKPACETQDAGLLEFLVDNRIINGTKTMVIDLEACVRCDECVKACESTHDGNPRFKRQPQSQYGRYMIANACMHCTDPVCMIGCPTGAIARDKVGGEIKIDPTLCIGCGVCANNCPYDNISMVNIHDKKGNLIVDKNSGKALQQATKCDLCSSQKNGPACERACAHNALKRLDFSNLDEFNQWVNSK